MTKVALVSGSASGLGRSFVEALLRDGHKVTGLDVAPATTEHVNYTHYIADMRDFVAVQDVVEKVEQSVGPIELLICNAGVCMTGAAWDFTADDFRLVLDTNLVGAAVLCSAVFRRMVPRARGDLLIVASGYGLVPGPLLLPYVASKFGLVGLGLGLRVEGWSHGINTSVLCPGLVRTGLPLTECFRRRLPASFTPRMRGLEPSYVVGRALVALRRRKAITCMPFSVKALWWLFRLAPAAIEWLGRLQVRQWERKQRRLHPKAVNR